MKLKLVVNGCEVPEDYKLLKTTVSTVASLRKTAVLRFTSERLVIISTPKSSSSSSSTILHADSGQLWCTIPQDLFKLYTVISARELNTITMEYNCDSLLSVFKRYDRVMNQGSSSNMTIKLQSMPEWNAGSNDPTNNSDSASKLNPVCALGITFEEIVRTQGANENATYGAGSTTESTTTVMGGFGSNKIVMHSFKVPVKLLFRAQDQRIQEPMIDHTHLMMCKLPSISGEYGAGFHSFIKRVERYTNVSHIKLSGLRKDDTMEDESDKLKVIVNELDWHLEICWNGPLDSVIQQGIQTQASQQADKAAGVSSPSHTSNSNKKTAYDDDTMRVEDSEIIDVRNSTTLSGNVDVELVDVSAMVEHAEQETSKIHEVMIRCKDWRVCDKLYGAFEEVVLAISHNESCVLHCSLDRGNFEDGDAADKPKERGQIIYYMARSKPL